MTAKASFGWREYVVTARKEPPWFPAPPGAWVTRHLPAVFGAASWRMVFIQTAPTRDRQFLPPAIQDMAAPPELLVQEMAAAGVDVAILQNARLYGRLNDYFVQAQQAYPSTFYGLADVDEARA